MKPISLIASLAQPDIHHRQNAFDWPDGEEELSHHGINGRVLVVNKLFRNFFLAEIRSSRTVFMPPKSPKSDH